MPALSQTLSPLPPNGALQLTSVEILYMSHGRPHLIQSFLWQDYDTAPHFPRLQDFLHFWSRSFDVTVHSVQMVQPEDMGTSEAHYVGYSLVVH